MLVGEGPGLKAEDSVSTMRLAGLVKTGLWITAATWGAFVGALLFGAAVHAEAVDAPEAVASTMLPWAVSVISTLVGIMLLVFWKWVDSISNSVKAAAAKTEHDKLVMKVETLAAELAAARETRQGVETRLTVVEKRCVDIHETGDRYTDRRDAKIDALVAKIDQLVEGQHLFEMRVVRLLAAKGIVETADEFGNPITNPGRKT